MSKLEYALMLDAVATLWQKISEILEVSQNIIEMNKTFKKIKIAQIWVTVNLLQIHIVIYPRKIMIL